MGAVTMDQMQAKGFHRFAWVHADETFALSAARSSCAPPNARASQVQRSPVQSHSAHSGESSTRARAALRAPDEAATLDEAATADEAETVGACSEIAEDRGSERRCKLSATHDYPYGAFVYEMNEGYEPPLLFYAVAPPTERASRSSTTFFDVATPIATPSTAPYSTAPSSTRASRTSTAATLDSSVPAVSAFTRRVSSTFEEAEAAGGEGPADKEGAHRLPNARATAARWLYNEVVKEVAKEVDEVRQVGMMTSGARVRHSVTTNLVHWRRFFTPMVCGVSFQVVMGTLAYYNLKLFECVAAFSW